MASFTLGTFLRSLTLRMCAYHASELALTRLRRPAGPKPQLVIDVDAAGPPGASTSLRSRVAQVWIILTIVTDFGTSSGRQFSYVRLVLTNFLSYRSASVEFGALIALVGPNASGKSNAVAAIKLLREIPFHGLPIAIARRGGFDQLRHRSAGRPYDPAIRLEFRVVGASKDSFYELELGAISGKRYKVKREEAVVYFPVISGNPDGADEGGVGDGITLAESGFRNRNGVFSWYEHYGAEKNMRRSDDREFRIPPGQSALTVGASYGGYLVGQVLQAMQTVEINPARVGELQEPSSTREFEPDGSNATSIFENLSAQAKGTLIDELAAIVPSIRRVEVRRFADRVTLAFVQATERGNREFLAKQMSDGTLRAFSILLAMNQPAQPGLLVIEEPEIAIHLGALRTLVDILKQQSETSQVVITTHSADIVDALAVDSLRVVWTDTETSHLAAVAEHTKETVRTGLITPGALLRADSLDPVET